MLTKKSDALSGKLLRLVPHLTFLLLLVVTCFLVLKITGEIFPQGGFKSIWFYSGISMVLFGSFYVEPYYVAPKNVLSHSIAVILVLIASQSELPKSHLASLGWKSLVFYAFLMLIISWTASALPKANYSEDHWRNKFSELLKNIAVTFGGAKILFSGVFILFLLINYSLQNPWVIFILIFWWILVIAEPHKFMMRLTRSNKSSAINNLGEVIGIQSKNVILSKLFQDSPLVKPLELLEFSFPADKKQNICRRGFVLENYVLDDQRWMKFLHLECFDQTTSNNCAPFVRRLSAEEAIDLSQYCKTILGVVTESSDIAKIRFEYMPGAPSINEGDLVEVEIGGVCVFYQITNAHTGTDTLREKNKSGFINVEASQLGRWDEEDGCFFSFGWLPEINTPVRKSALSKSVPEIVSPEIKLGNLPATQIPVAINLEELRTHHFAVLGITGAGKSFIVHEIIREMKNNTKIVCIDFTGEYIEKLGDLSPCQIIDSDGLMDVEKIMAEKADTKDKSKLLDYKARIQKKLSEKVKEFMDKENNLGILELPDLSNTSFILEFTQMLLESVFLFAKTNLGAKICIVVEEAHTVIPETTSLGDLGDYGSNKALVNKIGQIALQGRKYGVGFLVVAQRTANVSKTVLTQCNSLLCFQAFDETSYRFLENHIGRNMIAVLPRLRQYHAIAVGKAFRGNH